MNIAKFLRAAFFTEHLGWLLLDYTLFYKQCFFSTQPQCCLTSSFTFRCCLLHIAVIILRHILYLVYLCPCLGLGQFMSCLCDLFFIFSLIFVIINLITSFKQMYLFFAHFLEYLLVLLEKVRE